MFYSKNYEEKPLHIISTSHYLCNQKNYTMEEQEEKFVLQRNKNIVTSIPKELIRAAVREVYNNPNDPNRPKPDFTFDDIIIVPYSPKKDQEEKK